MTSASESLYISPQALSSAIKNLENELGITLLTRSNKGVKLTQHGQKVCAHAETILKNVHQIHDYCLEQQPVSAVSDKLSIATSPICAVLFLPHLLLRFATKFPDVKIATSEDASNEIIENVQNEVYDIGIITANEGYLETHYKKLKKELTVVELCTGHLSIICSAFSSAFEKKSISWKDACELPMIVAHSDNLELFHIPIFDTYKPKKTYNYTNINVTLTTILHSEFVGLGIDEGLKYMPPATQEALHVVPLSENIKNTVYLFCKKTSLKRPAIDAFFKLAVYANKRL